MKMTWERPEMKELLAVNTEGGPLTYYVEGSDYYPS